MRKLKPDYNSEEVQGKLVEAVCSFFGRIYDDVEQEKHASLKGRHPGDEKWQAIMQGRPTINETAVKFDVTQAKIRKILVTGGYYNTELYRMIKTMREQGMNLEEIAEKLGKTKGSIQSYLPYEKVIYMMEERSVNADRVQRFKERWGGIRSRRVCEFQFFSFMSVFAITK